MDKKYSNSIGVLVPEVMLPPKGTDMMKWAVVACDQFTSQKEYWEEARKIIGDAPSTLDLILPEAYLGSPDEPERIAAIKANMKEYLKKGILQKQPQGFVLVERTANGNTRHGLVMALDLEEYDYSKGSGTLIRATEGTIVSRIPPRLKIREGTADRAPGEEGGGASLPLRHRPDAGRRPYLRSSCGGGGGRGERPRRPHEARRQGCF